MAVMALSETLHADDRHSIDGAKDATPVIVTEPFSPGWYIETIRRLLHAGRARESYQMARIAADRHPGSADVRLAAAYAAAASGLCDLAIHQTHRRARLELAVPHSEGLVSNFSHSRRWVRSGWLDLRGRRTDYRLDMLPQAGTSLWSGFRPSFWVGVGVDRVGQSGPGLLAGSRARTLQTGLRIRMRHLTIMLRQQRRSERFTEPLAYLVAPHRAHTRTTGMDFIPGLSGKTNLKVAISLDHWKISSPDVSRPGSLKTLKFTFSYTFDPRP